MPCHHALADALRAYIDAAGIAEDSKGFLFRTSPRHSATVLTDRPLTQANAWLMKNEVERIRFDRQRPER